MTKRNVIELVDGRKVLVRPVSHILLGEIEHNVLRRFEKECRMIDPPRYTVELAGGVTQEYAHNKDTLEYPLELALMSTESEEEAAEYARVETAKARSAWMEYENTLIELQREVNEKLSLYAFEEGVVSDSSGECWDGTIPEEWIKRQKKYGFDIPNDPDELRMYYILRGLLITARDQVAAFAEIFTLTSKGIDSEPIEAALSFFRNQVEGNNPT